MGKILTETIERALLLEKNFKDVDLNKDKNSKKIFESARNALIAEIIKEIKVEEKNKIVEDAQEKIENERLINKIKDFKILTITSVFIAFFIGMAVNQITNFLCLFDFFKKWYGMFIIFGFSVFIIAIIILYIILKEFVKYLLKRGKNERDNSK